MMPARLEAKWKKLIMANYTIDPERLFPFVPYHTELDFYNDRCYISLVGFMFLDSRLGGIKIPLHGSFEEVNLRFYVRHKKEKDWKRGVVFIKEIVPKFAVTLVANSLYKENYETLPMYHTYETEADTQSVEYRWKKQKWNSIRIRSDTTEKELVPGSAEEFFTENYWGYTKIHDHLTLEYQVDHPPWKIFDTKTYRIDIDFVSVYGEEFAFLLNAKPDSVFLAEGSEIVLRKASRIEKGEG